jgi:hypothetical protein
VGLRHGPTPPLLRFMCNNLRMDADTPVCGRLPDSQYVELAVEVFAMLADATRVRLGRLVSTRQDGTRIFYRLANEHARQLVSDAIFQAEHALDKAPRHHHTSDRTGA